MNEQSANITYENVRSGAQTLQECSRKMDGIFQEFSASMNRVGAPDVYVGDAKETLSARYNALKTKFDDYVSLVNQFANIILGAAEQTEKTEASLATAAEELKG